MKLSLDCGGYSIVKKIILFQQRATEKFSHPAKKIPRRRERGAEVRAFPEGPTPRQNGFPLCGTEAPSLSRDGDSGTV
jgi:hypothetical protein